MGTVGKLERHMEMVLEPLGFDSRTHTHGGFFIIFEVG